MAALLRWWFLVCLTAAGAAVAGTMGLFHYTWAVDATKLSFAILGIFTAVTIFVGLLTFHARNGDQLFAKHLSFAWFTSEVLLGLGMTGTLIGFLILLQAAFGGQLDLSSPAAAQKVLASMAVGFATAGVTTLYGLVTSLLLKAQLINLEYLLDEEE